MITEIKTQEQSIKALKDNINKTIFLFKHSTMCSTSEFVDRVYRRFHEQHKDNPSYAFFYVLVIEARSVSNAIEQQTGIQHQSPQLIMLKNNSVVWHESHLEITENNIEKAVAKTSSNT